MVHALGKEARKKAQSLSKRTTGFALYIVVLSGTSSGKKCSVIFS